MQHKHPLVDFLFAMLDIFLPTDLGRRRQQTSSSKIKIYGSLTKTIVLLFSLITAMIYQHQRNLMNSRSFHSFLVNAIQSPSKGMPIFKASSRKNGSRLAFQSSTRSFSSVDFRQNKLSSSSSPSFSFYSCFSSSSDLRMSIADTNMGKNKEGARLLDGLDIFTIPANGDSHPLTVYGIDSLDDDDEKKKKRYPILLLHGRTWSSVPVYHLLSDTAIADNEGSTDHHSLSFMELLLETGNVQPYAMDFRGFGGTPPDHTGKVEPIRCVEDVHTVLQWITEKHQYPGSTEPRLALLGWSQGALVAQLVGQKYPEMISKLVLYASIYDGLLRYAREPLYTGIEGKQKEEVIKNTYDMAIEDFTIEGSIGTEQAATFAESALVADPIKAQWTSLHQFNLCDPARVHVPTLVVSTRNNLCHFL